MVSYTVQNIVAHASLGQDCRINEVFREQIKLSEYDPELFPGLRFTIPDSTVKCLVFLKGKCIITGAQTERDLRRAWVILKKVLSKHTIARKRSRDDGECDGGDETRGKPMPRLTHQALTSTHLHLSQGGV